MKIAINKNTGTRHIHGREIDPDKGAYKTLCGHYENACRVEDEPMLDGFEEQFGVFNNHCEKCTKALQAALEGEA